MSVDLLLEGKCLARQQVNMRRGVLWADSALSCNHHVVQHYTTGDSTGTEIEFLCLLASKVLNYCF
uniref:Uncharacterized protein n=1 Tax=Anguilla anguilla TaxID=7936 RepID=A0A0E9R7U0_ANGAN